MRQEISQSNLDLQQAIFRVDEELNTLTAKLNSLVVEKDPFEALLYIYNISILLDLQKENYFDWIGGPKFHYESQDEAKQRLSYLKKMDDDLTQQQELYALYEIEILRNYCKLPKEALRSNLKKMDELLKKFQQKWLSGGNELNQNNLLLFYGFRDRYQAYYNRSNSNNMLPLPQQQNKPQKQSPLQPLQPQMQQQPPVGGVAAPRQMRSLLPCCHTPEASNDCTCHN